MTFLPNDYEGSWTLASSVNRSGVCLHSGEESQVSLLPSEKAGFHVSWCDSKDEPVTVNAHQALESQLCTTLEYGSRKLITVEHILKRPNS